MDVKKPKDKKLGFDPERCNNLYEELVEVFQKHRPTVGEIIVAMGNLCYTLGASIGKFKKGPSFEEAKKLYYMDPKRVDLAMMMQGFTMTTWYGDWEELQLSKDTEEET